MQLRECGSLAKRWLGNPLEVLASFALISKETYALMLRDCSDVVLGRNIHAHMMKSGVLKRHPYLGDRLVQMYLKAGSMQDAKRTFENMSYKGVISSTLMISAYAQRGHITMALQLFRKMQLDGVRPDKVAFLAAVTALVSGECVEEGTLVHELLLERGLGRDLVVGNALVNMYGKFKRIEDARRVFDDIENPDIVSWNSVIAAYVDAGLTQEALFMFRAMQLEGAKPSNVTCVNTLNACDSPSALRQGRIIHACILEGGYEVDNPIVANALLHMYAKCGSPVDAQSIFDGMEDPDVVSWTAVIAAYALQSQLMKAMCIFSKMQLEGIVVDRVTLMTLLYACSRPEALESGKMLHGLVCQAGLDRVVDRSAIVIGNAVINMYGKCGSLDEARNIFDALPCKDDVVSWNTMIGTYAQFGMTKKCLELFWEMTKTDNVKPNKVTFVSVVNSCMNLEEGKIVHDLIVEQGLETEASVATSLVNLYGKHGVLKEARRIFDGMTTKLPMSWNCLMSAYIRWGNHHGALEIYRSMKDVPPDRITFVEALNTCSTLLMLPEGMEIHKKIIHNSEVNETDPMVATSLILMYSKCGTLEQACQVFEEMRSKMWTTTTVEILEAWNTMIGAYSHHGKPREAVELFRTMLLEDVYPDKVSFVNALSACSHGGLIREAWEYFTFMQRDYEIDYCEQHYGCIIDLLGRLGRLDEAQAFIVNVPMDTNWYMWGSFLGSCRTHGELTRAKQAAEDAFLRLEQQDQAAFGVMLSTIFAEDGTQSSNTEVE